MVTVSEQLDARARKKFDLPLPSAQGGDVALTRSSWRMMIVRCVDPSSPSYKDYGARGIFVCKRWMDFRCFLEDMGIRKNGTSIDRIDNNDGYYPENCRWATPVVQARNTRRNVVIKTTEGSLYQTDLAKKLGVAEATILRRLRDRPDDLFSEQWFKRAKLNKDQVMQIKISFSNGFKDIQVAERFGISRQMASCIRRGKYWGDVCL